MKICKCGDIKKYHPGGGECIHVYWPLQKPNPPKGAVITGLLPFAGDDEVYCGCRKFELFKKSLFSKPERGYR